MPDEIKIQDKVIKYLEKLDIYPFNVICSFNLLDVGGLVNISFYLKSDLVQFLESLNYYNLCDKSGFLIEDNSDLVILTGPALTRLYSKI